MEQYTRYFWVALCAIATVLIIPSLMSEGMFIDGVLYASVSKNMALGKGTFWFPVFSETWNKNGLPYFLEQTPLGLGLQALFFKLLGTGLYTERIYTLLTYIISVLLIDKVWKQINNDNQKLKQLSWIPVFFWTLIPVINWAHTNNVLETTMNMFVLATALLLIKNQNHKKTNFALLLPAGLLIFCASYTKGFPGLFPLALPGIFFIFKKQSFGRAIGETTVLLSTVFGIYFILFISIPDAYESMSLYLNNRVFNSIENVATESNRLMMLWKLFNELMLMLILSTLLLYLIKKGKLSSSPDNNQKSWIYVFLALGIAGSFPLMVTMEQRRFYLLPSLIFYTMAFSVFVAPIVGNWLEKINLKYLRPVSVSMLALSIVISLLAIQYPSRDKDKLHDMKIFTAIIGTNTSVTTALNLMNDWGLRCYYMRYYGLSFDYPTEHTFFIKEKSSDQSVVPDNYTKVGTSSLTYDLYQKINSNDIKASTTNN